ncbi:MAG TPA: hypothetical protein VGR90_03660 [Acidimicrobiales bacterium]|nr:hypothetical protein [Acidimicrobiales bacterium]
MGGLLGPIGGLVADRFDRRAVMIASELGAGAVYLAMTLAHAPLLLVLGTLGAAVAGTPFRAASAAASALSFGAFGAALVIDPALASFFQAGSVGVAFMAVSLGSIAVLPSFAAIVGVGLLGGFGSGFTFVPWLVLIQHHFADQVRGRAVAASETLNQVLFLAGMGAAVPAIALVNAHRAYAVAGILLALATVVGLRPHLTGRSSFVWTGER